MIEAGSLEYAHARLCARYGERPDELVWRRIEMIREFAAVLDTARATPLAPWIAGIGAQADAHAIELSMRDHLRVRIDAIASWMPPAWRASIAWCAVLLDLPLLQHLARGGSPPAWLANDPVTSASERSAFGRRGPAGSGMLAAGVADPDRMTALWRAEWRRRLPARGGASALLAELAALLDAHAALFRDPLLADGWAQRRILHARLSQLFRRATLDPAEAFIVLALSALDFERLRGELLRRVAFPRLPLAA